VRPPFATIELLQEVAVVSLTGLTCRRNCEFEVLKMTVAKYDLVAIGSGPAGQKGAIAAAKAGKRVAVIDRTAMMEGESNRESASN
jgi:NADPH-dependent 2,4-dienoyl-CoA reductase/sulfur reductase-like enzyme